MHVKRWLFLKDTLSPCGRFVLPGSVKILELSPMLCVSSGKVKGLDVQAEGYGSTNPELSHPLRPLNLTAGHATSCCTSMRLVRKGRAVSARNGRNC